MNMKNIKESLGTRIARWQRNRGNAFTPDKRKELLSRGLARINSGKMLLIVPVALIMTGCVGSSLSKLTKELKDDPAIVIIRLGTPWGSQQLTRIGGQTNSITVSPEGQATINQGK